METKALILVRGLPGSGKSTLAKLLADGDKYPIYSADDYFIDTNGEYNFDHDKLSEAHEMCRTNTEISMKMGFSKIFVANTFTQKWEMGTYAILAEEYGYQLHVIIVENRHGNANIHGVSDEVVERMKNRFDIKL